MTRFLLAILVLSAASLAAADFQTAMDAYNAGDFATAHEEWMPLAEAGSAAAQFNIGLLHERGEGRDTDLATALEWYVRAAENGFARAQFRLGELYDAGEGLERDLIESRKWFAIAADAKYPKAKKRKKQVAKEMTPHEIALGDMWARVFIKEQTGK